MSLIPEIPAAPFVPLYPALGSLNFNQEAYAYGTAMPGVTTRLREISAACRECALAAREDAMSAESSRMLSAQQADQVMSYRNQAANSATAAASSASTASTHASNAVGAYTQMQALYLGAKTSNPVKDNQGNALQLGAWYTYVGTDPDLKGVWLWWDGTGWNPGIGPVIGTLMPKSGGKFTGYASGPGGATGEQFPQAQEVIPRVSMQPSGKSLRTIVTSGFHRLDTYSDGPPGVDLSYGQLVVSRGGDTAFQLGVPYTEVGGPLVFRRGNPTEAGGAGSYGPWQQVLSSLWFVENVKVSTVPAGTGSYAVNPGEGSVHYVVINGAVTFNLPAQGRQLGDQVTLRVFSSGAVRPISFSANVRMPSGQSFPTYAADQVVTLVLFYGRQNVWDCFFAGVHSA
ncbi:hypothetical protein IAE26_26085 [Delftia sp. S67]|uniref:hypothetical protein n=2 Tax=Delftia TaxID=80865 RepID=UPI00190146E0|nr:hypothetical protein [Delftia sp. S67]MBK0121320.1 hypothetical protein [Delftia sp. S67]